MRARMALSSSGVVVRCREVVLRDKPDEMLRASAKGTVPVLILPDGHIVDESRDVMMWALSQSDPENWLDASPEETADLIDRNDGPFKAALDRYKYPNRYAHEGVEQNEQRALGLEFLTDLDALIAAKGGQLLAAKRSLADIAIFPFVRQFAHTDMDWFSAQPLPALQTWLAEHKASALFTGIMKKLPQWRPGAEEPLLPIAA